MFIERILPEWLNDPETKKYAVLITLLFFGVLETFLGHYKDTKRTKDDWITEFLGFGVLAFNTPLVLFGVLYIGQLLLPNAYNSLSHLSLWIAVPFYLFIDDFAQYWYH